MTINMEKNKKQKKIKQMMYENIYYHEYLKNAALHF